MQEIKIKLGGIERRVKTPLGLALDIEDATDTGVLWLTQKVARSEARLSQVVEVLRVSMARNGMVYERDEILDMIEQHEGISGAMLAAARVLNGLFFRTPQKRGKAEGNGAAALATAASL